MILLDKTKRNTLLLITVVLSISLIIAYLFLEYQFNISVNEQYKERYESVRKLFGINVEHERQKLQLELEKLTLVEDISEALYQKDREQLAVLIAPYFETLKRTHQDIKIFTFRTSDGVTLYRAHKPTFHGDTINEQRKLLIDTSRMKKSLNGFEVGKFGMTYRITQPFFYKGIYVGNVEIGLDPMHFMKNLHKVFDLEVGVAINKALLQIMLHPNMIPITTNYVLLEGNEKLKDFFLESKKAGIDPFNPNNVIKVNMDIPLTNHRSEVLGYLVVGFDTADIIEQKKILMHRLLFLMVVMSFIIGYVLHKGFARVLEYFTEQLYVDQLTKLQNRLALNDTLLTNKKSILILSDIKDFSIINELYGVEIGNKVLVEFSKFYAKFASKHGFKAFRISSDEFVMLKHSNSYDDTKCLQLLDSLHKEVSGLEIKLENLNEIIKIDIHCGWTYDHSFALEEAQMALKKAKERSVPYLKYSKKVDTKERSENILHTKRVIKDALECYNVIPFFQPITDINGKFIKHEALVRILEYNNGKRSILYPDSFLEISKRNGLYGEIAVRVIRQSLLFFVSRDEKISINLYPSDLFNQGIMDTIVECIQKFDSPNRVVIEILEQENLGDINKVSNVIEKLRKIGVLIAIDDFGSGYSNYSHILKLKPDYLKIDASLIRDILRDEESKILVKSIVKFAKDLDIITVAEYVENKEVFELLKQYGVDEFQGYYFSRPIDLLGRS